MRNRPAAELQQRAAVRLDLGVGRALHRRPQLDRRRRHGILLGRPRRQEEADVVHARLGRIRAAASRVIRGATISIIQHQYIEAARAVGAGHVRIMCRYVFPNVTATIIITAIIITVIMAITIIMGTGMRICCTACPSPTVPMTTPTNATG